MASDQNWEQGQPRWIKSYCRIWNKYSSRSCARYINRYPQSLRLNVWIEVPGYIGGVWSCNGEPLAAMAVLVPPLYGEKSKQVL